LFGITTILERSLAFFDESLAYFLSLHHIHRKISEGGGHMEHLIKVDKGVSLFVKDLGEGTPIVFLHGWPINHEMYEYQSNLFPQMGFRFVAIDFRGYGKSSAPLTGYDYNTMADDVRKVIDRLKLKNIILAGFSMGGAIAIRYMAKHNGHRVRKLALFGACAPSFIQSPNNLKGHTNAEIKKIHYDLLHNRPLYIESLIKEFFYEKYDHSFKDWFRYLCLTSSSYATISSLMALRDERLGEDLKTIKVPTAIFHGIHDLICPYEFAEQMHKEIGNSRIITFEKSGHGLFFDEMDKFNNELLDFIR